VELQRNPNKSKEEIEERLKEIFGVQKIIWLKKGMVEDDHTFLGKLPGNLFTCNTTGGHIDEVSSYYYGDCINTYYIVCKVRWKK
jgi:agmatine deiminase